MAMESNIYALWGAKQTAKGTPASASTRRLVQVAGDSNINRDDASEPYSDLDRFGQTQDWANTLVGNLNPGIEATPSELGWLMWMFFGAEVQAGGTSQVTTITGGGATGGTFNLNVAGVLVSAIPFNTTAAALQTTLNAALAGYGGAAAVTAGGGPLQASPITLTFGGVLANRVVSVTIDTTLLTGGTTTVATSTPAAGSSHTFTPNQVGGFWGTFWQRVGATQIKRHKFNDTKFASLMIEGSTGAKAVRITPTGLSLDPGEAFAVDPTTGMPADQRVFLYTEGQSSYTIDGVVLTGQSQFSITWNENLVPVYGDSVTPQDLVPGAATIDMAITLQLDANGLAQYNKVVYGTAAPAPGAKPLKSIPAMGSWSCLLTKDVAASLSITIPSVKWSPDMAIPPNPAGGPVELAMAGQMRKILGTQASTVVVKNGDAAYTN